MNKSYQCKKCGNMFKDEQSDKFVKTMLKTCPVCGSSEVAPAGTIKVTTKGFAKKSKQ
jgi:predicted  nucleic acid-binding Zn-ribbon protein